MDNFIVFNIYIKIIWVNWNMHKKQFVWDIENYFLLRVMGGMEKDVHIWYVILMEDG